MGRRATASERSRVWRCALALAAALAACIGPAADAAAAQDDAPSERQYLTGDWNGVRPLLSNDGIRPYLTYTGLLWANLAGGESTGAQVNGYLDFGLDLDLAKFGAWNGLGFHADFHWWQGTRPTQQLIGGLLALSLSGWEAANTFRVYNLYLRQSFGDAWLIKIGQIGADSDFMISRYGGVFLNAAFGDFPSQNLNLDAPVYPLAAPGVFASGQPLAWLTGRFGAYTGEAGSDVSSNHGFGWGLGNNAGYTFFWELAAAPATAVPATYTLGAIYDTGGSSQFGTHAQRLRHYELYLMIDQALLADDQGNPIIGGFARMSGSPQDTRNVVSVYADSGIALFGLVPGRPKDVLGAAFCVMRFTNDFQQQEEMDGTPVGTGTAALEVTYQIAIAPWLVVQPDAQFFFNPSFSRRDAQAIGGQLVAMF